MYTIRQKYLILNRHASSADSGADGNMSIHILLIVNRHASSADSGAEGNMSSYILLIAMTPELFYN